MTASERDALMRAAPERAESERRDVFGRAIDMSVEALRQRNEKAHEMVTALCKPRGTEGSREWIMSIPARPDDDPDLVINQALNDAKRLIDRLAAPPPSTDALWREYATARTDVVNAERDLRECVARAAEHRYPPAWACQDYVRRADEAWHRLDAAVRALAAGDGQDSRAWRPVDPNNLPEPQWMLVTNNIDARDARGDMSHLWLVYMLHAPSLNEPQYGVTAFSGNRRICYITHWRPAIPEGADRMIVAATDPEGA